MAGNGQEKKQKWMKMDGSGKKNPEMVGKQLERTRNAWKLL